MTTGVELRLWLKLFASRAWNASVNDAADAAYLQIMHNKQNMQTIHNMQTTNRPPGF